MLQFRAESDQLQRRIACGLWDGFDVRQIIGEKRNWTTTDHIWSQPDHLHLRAAQGEIFFCLFVFYDVEMKLRVLSRVCRANGNIYGYSW